MNIIITNKQVAELKNKLNESPDKIIVDSIERCNFKDFDAVAFGFFEDKVYVGLNYHLFEKSNLDDDKKKYVYDKIDKVPYHTFHSSIPFFYNLIYKGQYLNDDIPEERDKFKYAGRLWFSHKIITFWDYPPKNKLTEILKKISDELYTIYNFKINFNNFNIEVIADSKDKLSCDWYDFQDYKGDCYYSGKNKKLIPVKDYIGSQNASEEEMQAIHLLPSAEKRKTPQMKAALADKYKAKGEKFGGTPEVKYNFYKHYGMGDSVIKKGRPLNESPSEIYDDGVECDLTSGDSLTFGMYQGKMYVGLNHKLVDNSNLSDDIKETVSSKLCDLCYTWHDGIYYFYNTITNNTNNNIPKHRESFTNHGRLWFEHKVISFYDYPKPSEIINFFKLLSNEIYRIYNYRLSFNDFKIEIISEEDNDRILIPIKDYIGSQNASEEEMQAIHLLPSAEKRKTPQMKAALADKYKAKGEKFGGTPEAKYNFYKHYGMGDSVIKNGNIIIEESDKVIYSAIFVNENELIKKYKPVHENIFYDHSTIEFNPKDISNIPIGKRINIKIKGRLTTDKVDALLVENEFSLNEYPHITLSTAKGVKPFESNSEIKNNLDKVVALNDSIQGVVGCYTNKGLVTEDITIPVNKGDIILTGKFRNKKTKVNKISKDEHSMPTINDKKVVNFRIIEQDNLNEVEESEVDLTSFKVKKELNPKIWTNENNINKKVRLRLLKISDDFIDLLKINSNICEDVLMVGSLANYNWSKYSDIDLHILIDFSKISKDVDLIKDYFDSKRSIWNDEHSNLTIYGFPVEVYVQDVNEDNASTAIYSLNKNKWLKKPKFDDENTIDSNKVKTKSADLMTKIDKLNDKLKKDGSNETLSNEVKGLFDKIKKIRKSGLESDKNEFSNGNVVYKVLRRSGYMEKLIDLKRDTYDKLNTIK